MIQVRRTAEHDSFEVVVREGKGESRHHVTMSREMCERLTAGKHTPGDPKACSPEMCVKIW